MGSHRSHSWPRSCYRLAVAVAACSLALGAMLSAAGSVSAATSRLTPAASSVTAKSPAAGTSETGTTATGTPAAATSKAGTSHNGTSQAGTSQAGTSRAGTSRAGTSTAGTTGTSNLLVGSQATFDGTTGGWVGANSSLSWVPAPSTTGAGALDMTATSTTWPEAWSALPPDGTATPAAPGAKFAADAAVNETGTPQLVGVVLAFFNSSHSIVGTAFGEATTPSASTWTTLPEVAGIAPSATVSVALVVIEYTASVGQQTYIESPVITALSSGLPAVDGPLHTSGNEIVQANGHPVTLEGVVLEGLENSGVLADTGVTYDAVVEAKAWGANFVRVPLGEQFWLSSNCDYVSSYESTVDEVVHWITSMGMVALLDLHANTVGGCEAGTEHNMADEAQSPTFWSEVAGRYGNPTSAEYDPLVAFDLYNEPHSISSSVWLNGGETTDYYSPNQTYEAAGMQQLYDSVRAAGSQNLVFISGNNWANDPPSQLVSGTNIVYAVHYYTCPSAAPPSCTNANPYDPAQDLDLWVPLSASEPVMVTEFGWPSNASETYIANVIAFAEEYGWGWSAFAWQEEANGGGFDFETWMSDGTAEPEPSGIPILLALSEGG